MAQTNVQAFSGDVEISSNLAVTGNAYVSSNLEVGTANLFVDTVNSRVGIGTTNPGLPLELYTGNGANYHLRLKRYPTGATYSDIGHLSTPGTEGLVFKTGNGNATTTEVMRVCGNGNVGIGTNNPEQKMHLHKGDGGQVVFAITNTDTGSTENSGLHVGIDASENGFLFHKPNKAFIFATNNTERMRITNVGNVGIGLGNPAAKLHVNGGAGGIYATAADFTRYFSWGTGSSVVGGSGNFNFTSISVYGTNDIGTAGTFVSTIRAITASDKRIKRDVVDLEDDEALSLLRLIEPKKYKYKDVLGRGDAEVYGFIAQQISNVFPEATQLRSSYIPNIYETANVASNTI
jgi:hypothetical protein